jgi:hypothetical protein
MLHPSTLIQLNDRFWPNLAVQLSISGHGGGIVADCHVGQEPTRSGSRYAEDYKQMATVAMLTFSLLFY